MPAGMDSRFVVPQIPNATLRREDLLARLSAGDACPFTLVSAGPGSGKTALLASWTSTLPGVAWLSCDIDDADAGVFWQHVARAISGPGGEILADPDPREEAASLVRTLGAPGRPTVLVIDDFHLARPHPTALLDFVAAVPEGARLVLSTRTDPALPLGRLRLQGRVLELRQSDLRFSRDETAVVLDALGVSLADSELDTLDTLTEGWTAGVQLAGLSLRAHPRPVELLRSLAETDHSLVDLLMNEVIDLQPGDMREFLLVTAELEAFDAALCDAITGRADSAEMIERVRAANLFLVQVDPDRGWYRYHHLFGQFLRARLRATAPDRISVVHRAAAAASDARGESISAVRHAMQAGDVDDARRMLNAQTSLVHALDDLGLGGEVARAWLREYGTAYLDDMPGVVLECALLLTVASVGEAEPWLARVEERASSLTAEDRALMHGVWSRHLVGYGDVEGSLERARLAQQAMPAGFENPWLAALPNVVTQAQLLLHDLDGLDETLDEVRRSPGPAVLTEVRLPGCASLLAMLRGELLDAERWVTLAEAAAERLGLTETNAGRADGQLALGMLLLERGDLSAAEVAFDRTMRTVEGGARVPIELLVHLELVKLAVEHGDHRVAMDEIVDARRCVPRATPRVLALIDASEARLALAQSEVATAARLVSALPPSTSTALLTVRVRLAEGERAEAARLLDDLVITNRRERLERSLLVARALLDRPEAATKALEEALEIALPVGFHRSIVSEGPEVLALLDAITAGGTMGDYVARLLSASRSEASAPGRMPTQDLVDPLSERELTVLRQLASPQDSREIANTMYLSVNTVRTHVKAIYRKLDVSSRADAVARGRDLSLL